MELQDLLNEVMPYLLGIMGTVITYIASKLGMVAKDYFDDITKRNIAEQTVMFVQQVAESMGSSEKFEMAKSNMIEQLNDKGIKITDLEVQVLLESAIKGFKNTWNSEVIENEGE